MFGRNGNLIGRIYATDEAQGNEQVNSGTDNAINESEGVTGNAEKEPEQAEKTFTQRDVNNLVARESKAAQEKLLKDLGIEDFENAKDGLAKFKEWQDSQMTEAEKQSEALREAQTQLEETTSKIERLEAEREALIQGVNQDSLNDVITLAKARVNEETGISDAIKAVVEQYPQFKALDEETVKPKFINPKNPSRTNENALRGFDLLLEKTKQKRE